MQTGSRRRVVVEQKTEGTVGTLTVQSSLRLDLFLLLAGVMLETHRLTDGVVSTRFHHADRCDVNIHSLLRFGPQD